MVYKKLKTPKKLYFHKIKIYLKNTAKENMFFKRKFGIKSDCYVFISATEEEKCKNMLAKHIKTPLTHTIPCLKKLKTKARLAFTADKTRCREQRNSLLENISKYKSKKFNSMYCNRAKVELKFFEEHPELSVAYVLDYCRRKGISLHKFMSSYVRQKPFNLISDDSKLLEVINDIKQIHSQETNLRDCSMSRSDYSADPWEDSFSKKDDTNTGTQEDLNVKILRRNKRPFDQIGMESTHLQNNTQLVGNISKTRDILATSISTSNCSNINKNMNRELAQDIDNLDQGGNDFDIHSTESSLGPQNPLFSENETKLDEVQVTDDGPLHLKATHIKSTHDVGLLATDDSMLSKNFRKISLQGGGFQTVDDCNIHSTEASQGSQNYCSENGTEFNEVQATDDGSLYLKVTDHKPTHDLGPLVIDDSTVLESFRKYNLQGVQESDDYDIYSTVTSKGSQNPCYPENKTELNEVQVTDDGPIHLNAFVKHTEPIHDIEILATDDFTLSTSKGPQNSCSENGSEFNEVQATDDGSLYLKVTDHKPTHDLGPLAIDDSTVLESFRKYNLQGVRGSDDYDIYSTETRKGSQEPRYSENETDDGPIHLNVFVKHIELILDTVTTDDSTDSESFRKNSLQEGFQEHSTETNKGLQSPCYSRKETVYRLCINETELDSYRHSTESSLGPQNPLFSENETEFNEVQVTDDGTLHLKATDIKSTHDVGLLATDDSMLSKNFRKISLQGGGFQTVDDCNIDSTGKGSQNSCSENGTEFNEVQATDDGSLYLKVTDHKPTHDLGPLAIDDSTVLESFVTDDVTDDGSPHLKVTNIGLAHDVGPSICTPCNSNVESKILDCIIRDIESTYDSLPLAGSARASGDSTIYTELTEDYITSNDMYSTFDRIYQCLKQKGKLNPAFRSPRNLSVEEILAVANQDASLDVNIFEMRQ